MGMRATGCSSASGRGEPMKRLVLLLVALGASSLAAPLPFPRAKTPYDDLKALQGEWEAVRPRGTTVWVKGDRMSFFRDGELRATWVVTMGPVKTPNGMDL